MLTFQACRVPSIGVIEICCWEVSDWRRLLCIERLQSVFRVQSDLCHCAICCWAHCDRAEGSVLSTGWRKVVCAEYRVFDSCAVYSALCALWMRTACQVQDDWKQWVEYRWIKGQLSTGDGWQRCAQSREIRWLQRDVVYLGGPIAPSSKCGGLWGLSYWVQLCTSRDMAPK